MSTEELKIRSELEMDVERDLEEEIKDGIYHLALRLHRLYQHQKERRDHEKQGKNKKNDTFSEVNINIKMEGGTKIEIKETKKEACENVRPKSSTRSENMHEIVALHRKKFDWVNTLRSSKKSDDPLHHKPKLLGKSRSANENVRVEGDMSQRKRKTISIKRPEQRELGWKE